MTKEEFLKVHLCKTCVNSSEGSCWHYCNYHVDENRGISCVNIQHNNHCYGPNEGMILTGCCNIIKRCRMYKEKK